MCWLRHQEGRSKPWYPWLEAVENLPEARGICQFCCERSVASSMKKGKKEDEKKDFKLMRKYRKFQKP
jgi:hypothetical protein